MSVAEDPTQADRDRVRALLGVTNPPRGSRSDYVLVPSPEAAELYAEGQKRGEFLRTLAEGRVMQSFADDSDDRSKNLFAVDLLIERGYRKVDSEEVADALALLRSNSAYADRNTPFWQAIRTLMGAVA